TSSIARLGSRRALVWLAATTVTMGAWALHATAQPAVRIVAVADVHGDGDAFAAILQAAGLIDGSKKWSGGGARLVQTGDVLDRGPKVREALDLLMQLEPQAQQ